MSASEVEEIATNETASGLEGLEQLEPGACRGESALDVTAHDELTATLAHVHVDGEPSAEAEETDTEAAEGSEEEPSGTELDLTIDDKHLFILSSAGKPIYSWHGKEEKLAGLCGVVQALVNVAGAGPGDALRSLRAGSCRAVFLTRSHLILVCVSRKEETEAQLALQLTYAFNQIVSVLTLSQLNRIFEQRRNYDLRRLLAGAERLVGGAAAWAARDPSAALGAVRVLPLPPGVREHVANALVHACAPLRDLVFALVLAGDRLVSLARMRKYTLHPADLHLLLNLVRLSESFRTAESWTPVCLPKFDATGFLHAHVSYVSEGSAACVLLLTVQRDAFYALSQAKQVIGERLRRHGCVQAIDTALAALPDPLRHIGAAEIRHFMYKCKSTAQLLTSGSEREDAALLPQYAALLARVHAAPPARPAKLLYAADSARATLAWATGGFELYVTLAPLGDKSGAILAVDRLLRWIKREEERVFIVNAPIF